MVSGTKTITLHCITRYVTIQVTLFPKDSSFFLVLKWFGSKIPRGKTSKLKAIFSSVISPRKEGSFLTKVSCFHCSGFIVFGMLVDWRMCIEMAHEQGNCSMMLLRAISTRGMSWRPSQSCGALYTTYGRR